jgi:hypothetical protein
MKRALLLLAILLGTASQAGQQGFETRFVWAQATWSASERRWCITAQAKGSSKFVGACAPTLDQAERILITVDEARGRDGNGKG